MKLPRKQKKAIKKANPNTWKWVIAFKSLAFWSCKCAYSLKELTGAFIILDKVTPTREKPTVKK